MTSQNLGSATVSTSGGAVAGRSGDDGTVTAVLPVQPAAPAGAQATGAPAGTQVMEVPAAAHAGRRPWRRGLLVIGGLLTAGSIVAASTVYARSTDGSGSSTAPSAARAAASVAAPAVAVAGRGSDGTVPWQAPLSVTVTGGTLTSVSGRDPDGKALQGAVGPDGRWTSAVGLIPASTYSLMASVRDTSGEIHDLPLSATTSPPGKTVGLTIAPGDGAVVGVGQAISVRLAKPVKDKATRAEVEKRLAVTTVPAVVGAWRWISSSEVRYRGPELWPAGTKVSVGAALDHVQVVPGMWGSSRSASFTVGDALTSVVDTKAHTMTVSKNGSVLRVMKASMGKPQFPTRNGTFVVLEKFADRIMDSATVDLPPGTPAYRTAVKDAVRITNSGTFTHGAPWSVRSQGKTNVSHGCINLAPADAHWYYLQATRGDVVTVVNSTTGPNLSDAGSQDWNMTFDKWKSGSALA